MLKNYIFIIIIIEIINFDISGQWIHCNGEYANVQIHKFILVDSLLVAGCKEGVIYYNRIKDSWDQKLETGAIIDITSHNGKLYLINAANQIKVISSSKEMNDIHFNLGKFDIKSITHILVYNNSLYVGGFKDVFYQSLGDTIWYKINAEKNIASPLDIKKIIEYQGKLLVLSRHGIHVSNNGTTFSRLIRNEDILRFGSTLNSPPEPKVMQSYKLKSVACNEKSLYAYSGMEIFKTEDMVKWEKYDVIFSELMQLKTICCDGIILNTLGNLSYSFQKNIWEKIPPLKIGNIYGGAPSVFCVYHNKIFGGVIYPDNNSIWQMNFNYSLKF
jgi:hypothetical protein